MQLHGGDREMYLLHFTPEWQATPERVVRHYLGTTTIGVSQRQEVHRRGRGAKLLAAITQLGIDWTVVRVWPSASYEDERKLKKAGHYERLCPRCTSNTNVGNKEVQDVEAEAEVEAFE